MVIVHSDGSFAYTPAAHYSGPDSFTFKANDGALDSSPATLSITITSINQITTAGGDAYNTDRNPPLSVSAPGVLANDTDTDGDALSVELVNGPTSGTLTLNPDGSFTFMPQAGFVGLITFTYRVSDGSTYSSPAIVRIIIASIPITGSGLYLPLVTR